MKDQKLTAKHMALLAIVDAMRADLGNGSQYVSQHPTTHEDLPDRTVEAVERNIRHIVDSLNKRLPVWARR